MKFLSIGQLFSSRLRTMSNVTKVNALILIRYCNLFPLSTIGRNIEKWEWVFAEIFSGLIGINIRSKKGSIKISQSMQSSAAYFQKSILFNLYYIHMTKFASHEQTSITNLFQSTYLLSQFFILANRLNAISQI